MNFSIQTFCGCTKFHFIYFVNEGVPSVDRKLEYICPEDKKSRVIRTGAVIPQDDAIPEGAIIGNLHPEAD